MKKLILVASIFAFANCAMLATTADANTNVENVISKEPKYMKSKEGTWMGANKTWYKLNTKDATVSWSKDGKEWAEVPEWKWEGVDGVWNKFDKDWSLWTAKM